MGNTRVASAKILTYCASSLSLAQVQPSEALAPESLPSSQRPVFMQTAQSRPLRQMLELRMWCLGMPPPMTMAPDLGAFMASLQISLVSPMRSMTRSFLKELVKRTSPMPPSVSAGQKTGILFLQHQQQMLSSLLISLPKRSMTLRGVHFAPSFACSLYIFLKTGSRNSSSLMQLSLATRMLPMRQCPFSLFSMSFMLNSPRWKLPMHFIRSSSMPPAVVTMQSIIRCCAKYLMISRIPHDDMFEVQPRKMVHLVLARQAGSLVSSSSRSLRGSSDSRQLIMLLMISMARCRWVAWKPMVAKLLKSASQCTPWLKSQPFTALVSSCLFLWKSSLTCFSTSSGETILDSLLMFNNYQRILIRTTITHITLHLPPSSIIITMKTAHLLLLLLLASCTLPQRVPKSDPYSLLKLNRSATQGEIDKQYKRLKQKSGTSKKRRAQLRRAYEEIVRGRKEGGVGRGWRAQDESYVYGYRISFEFDDGKHFQAMYNETQFIVDRSSSSTTSKKVSALVLLVVSMLFKMLPCLLLAWLCRCRWGEGAVEEGLRRLRRAHTPLPTRQPLRL